MPIETVIEKLGTSIGQGSILEQIDKLLRSEQRKQLLEMLEKVKDGDIKHREVKIEFFVPQSEKKRPATLRFFLPDWRGYDEIFWHALGDYVILALHSVKDVKFDTRGKITLHYFATMDEEKLPEEIKDIIRRIAYLVETEILPTDFTRFRRMDERRHHLGEMSKEEAAAIGAAFKLITSALKL
jgi:hypothetical protein